MGTGIQQLAAGGEGTQKWSRFDGWYLWFTAPTHTVPSPHIHTSPQPYIPEAHLQLNTASVCVCVCMSVCVPIGNCPATGVCFTQSVLACGSSLTQSRTSVHACRCVCVCAKVSNPIMLKLRGSTFLLSYHLCKP